MRSHLWFSRVYACQSQCSTVRVIVHPFSCALLFVLEPPNESYERCAINKRESVIVSLVISGNVIQYLHSMWFHLLLCTKYR